MAGQVNTPRSMKLASEVLLRHSDRSGDPSAETLHAATSMARGG